VPATGKALKVGDVTVIESHIQGGAKYTLRARCRSSPRHRVYHHHDEVRMKHES
jgi:hypothetical protein